MRLFVQLMIESIAVSLLGGFFGLLLAYAGTRAFVSLIPDTLPNPTLGLDHVTIDYRVLAFAFVMSLLSAFIFGSVPAIHAIRGDVGSLLGQGARASGTRASQRLLQGLAGLEVALGLILLTGAGLMIRSFTALQHVSPGFDLTDRLLLRVAMPRFKMAAMRQPQQRAYYTELLKRIERAPGVSSVGLISNLPLDGASVTMPFSIEGVPTPSTGGYPETQLYSVSPGYFASMGIPLMHGRVFSDRDNADSANPVIVVSESFAERCWPKDNPIGKRLKSVPATGPWFMVIGVVGDVRHDDVAVEPTIALYMPYLQHIDLLPTLSLVVHTAIDPLAAAGSVRREIAAFDRDQPVSRVTTTSRLVADATWRPRFSTLLLPVFGILALALAAIGLYGVTAYSVAQRTREIGIRMALGAAPSKILRLILVQGLRPVLVGLAVGLAASAAAARWLSGLLYGVEPNDSTTFCLVTIILISVSFLACICRVEP